MKIKNTLVYLIIILAIFFFSFTVYKKKSSEKHREVSKLQEDNIRDKYKNWNDINPNFKEIYIKKYYSGLNIFSDRHYFNHKNDHELNGLYLIQIPRHYNKDIVLNIFNEVVIYRVLCKKNNNEKYKNWNKKNYKLAIIGSSCVHEDVISKKIGEGILQIIPGGPVSSDPIFVYDSNSNSKKFEIFNKSDK